MSTKHEEDLELRVTALEDRLAIYALIASHPPSADTAYADYTRAVYEDDGVFDCGPTLEGARGVEAIAAFTSSRSTRRRFAAVSPTSLACRSSTFATAKPS
jgi:SnoaL-like domain